MGLIPRRTSSATPTILTEREFLSKMGKIFAFHRFTNYPTPKTAIRSMSAGVKTKTVLYIYLIKNIFIYRGIYMQALSSSRLTLVCFVLRLFLFPNKLDSWDSFNTKPTSAGHSSCILSRISSKLSDSTCRFTQRRDRISDTFNQRSCYEPHRANEQPRRRKA